MTLPHYGPADSTLIAGADDVPTEHGTNDVSNTNVGVVHGKRPRFSEETTCLLRTRLNAAALVTSVVLAAALLGNAIDGITTLEWLRTGVFLIVFACYFTLRRYTNLTLSQLRWLELAIFGSVMVQLSLMLIARVAEFTALHDAVSVVSGRQQMVAAWSVLILVYGIFLPNSWLRAAAVLIPASLLPYLVLALQSRWSPETAALFAADKAVAVLPLPLVAAFVSIVSTQVINSARREAFKTRRFGQYRLLECLGVGGMGEVYQGEHLLLKRPCAIKLIRTSRESDAKAVARFEKEVQSTARLSHPNTVEIFDYGRTHDGTFYYVMELLPGLNLERLVEKYGPLPPARTVYLLRQICGALQEAHGLGLIHRDIKPANIFAAQRGGMYDVAKLLDFGLVKEKDDASDGRAVRGTPLYMSPEQAAGYDKLDARSDIYSLGAVGYYLLTGRPLFVDLKTRELLAAHRTAKVTPPTQLHPTIPTDLEAVVLKCLAKKPDDRYSDAAALAQALDSCSAHHGWGPEQAAEWWKKVAETVPSDQTNVTTVVAEADVDTDTMKHKPNDT